MNVAGGALETDCNFILLPYCDGAAFAGYREKRVDVPGSPGRQLHMRGIRNLVETVRWAIADHGLRDASQLVVTGDLVGGVRGDWLSNPRPPKAARVSHACKTSRSPRRSVSTRIY